MKRIILLISILCFTSACTNIRELDYKENINKIIKYNESRNIYNRVGNGYKYYLPKYMTVKNCLNYNEKITSDDYTYYLYVDIVSYYNKKNLQINDNNGYINYKFKNNNIDGYLRVSEENDKYLVEIIYNYAKIEVKVNKNDLNIAINNSIIILSTIEYNNDLIKNIIEDKKINSKEETLNIFGNNEDKDNFMDIIEEYDTYDETEIPDYDVIN